MKKSGMTRSRDATKRCFGRYSNERDHHECRPVLRPLRARPCGLLCRISHSAGAAGAGPHPWPRCALCHGDASVSRRRHAPRLDLLLRGGDGDRRHGVCRDGGARQVPLSRRGDRMTDFSTLPLWIVIPVASFLVLGSTLTLIGTIGLATLKSFYDRIHASTLGTSWGTAGIVMASMLFGSYIEERAVIHEIILGIFITIT